MGTIRAFFGLYVFLAGGFKKSWIASTESSNCTVFFTNRRLVSISMKEFSGSCGRSAD
jgi:hypothetical protein